MKKKYKDDNCTLQNNMHFLSLFSTKKKAENTLNCTLQFSIVLLLDFFFCVTEKTKHLYFILV